MVLLCGTSLLIHGSPTIDRQLNPQRWMDKLSEPGRMKFNVKATYYLKVTGNLSWNVSFCGNWDNRLPARFSRGDYGSTSGLSWTFGVK